MAKNLHNTLPTPEQHQLRPLMNVTQKIDEKMAEEIRAKMEHYGIDMFQCTYHGPEIDNVEDIEYTPDGFGENNGDFFEDWVVFLEDLLLQNMDANSRGAINLYRTVSRKTRNQEEV